MYPTAERLLEHCDAVLRLPGESTGADQDVAIAKERGLPVYHRLDDVPAATLPGMIELSGRWALVAANGEDNILNDYADGQTNIGAGWLPLDEFNRRWLAGEPLHVEPTLTPLTGLTLTIAEDGAFTETGDADVVWFDDEGVLEMNARPFDGTLVTAPGGTFLLGAEGVQAATFADATDLRLRIDDGDTGITDLVRIDGDQLFRTMSMITDEMYPARIRLAYRRA